MSEFRREESQPRSGLRTWVRLDLRRAAAASVLLAGLFALLYVFLLPGGGADSTEPAIRIDTPAGPDGVAAGIHPGSLARDFEASNLDGLRFRLSELRGRPTVINFWATWCTSCLAEMPTLEQQRREHEDEGLAVVGVNVGERSGDAREFIEALELFEFAIAMDPDLTIADMYAVQGLPHSVFIDSEGVIQAEYRGQLDEETMESYVRAAIDAVPGGEAATRLRFVTTVPREHVLDVIEDENEPGQLLFVSRRFRCDDDYCAEGVIDGIAAVEGVLAVELRREALPPDVTVKFEPATISREELVAAVAEALRMQPDPLYTRELEIHYAGMES